MKKGILILSIISTLVAVLFLSLYPKSRLPKMDGTINLKNLRSEVIVTRDKWGIPHIEAENELDLHRALGFTMAGDRLFQMDLMRRIVNGELSEVLGEKTVEFDILLRKLRLRAHMNDFWENNRHRLDPKMLSLMDAFFDGVHQYMETQPLPIEFKILGYKPRPFSHQESMGLSGYLALSFAEALLADPLYTDLKSSLPKEIVDKMYIREGNDKNTVTEKNETSFNIDKSPWYKSLLQAHSFFRDVLGLFHGSNSWVLGPSRSQSGFPILANDPHVAFSNPSVWYEAHLKSPEYEIYGHFIPLVPFASMGHDQFRGWAVTMSEIDDMDLYEEKINEKGEVQYRGAWVAIKEYDELIKVRGGKDIKMKVRVTPHGPLLNGTKYGIKGKDIALKWSYHHPQNDIGTAFYKLSRTKTLDDLAPALSHGATPGLNVSWVDKKGNIAWKVMGKIPIRRGFRGNQILKGWDGSHEYERYFTIDEQPGMTNPKGGVIVTANYRPQYSGALPLEGYWQPSERFERIYDLLKEKKKWTLEEMKSIQNDQHVVTGVPMRDVLLSEVKTKNDFEEKVIAIFRKWRGQSDKDSIGSSIYHMWTHHLGKMAIKDELGEKRFIAYNKVADFWNFFKSFIYEKSSPLWDDVNTPQVETRSLLINNSFRKMITRLKEKLGTNISDWKWGELHTIEFEHPLGKAKPLNHIFNLGPFPAGGGYFQVDNMSTARYEDSFNVLLGASVRRLIDFKDPSVSFGVLPTGNVGHFNSEFYADQVEMFLAGKYREQWLDLTQMRQNPHHTLKLMPR